MNSRHISRLIVVLCINGEFFFFDDDSLRLESDSRVLFLRVLLVLLLPQLPTLPLPEEDFFLLFLNSFIFSELEGT